MRERLGQGEAAFPQGLADDCAGGAAAAKLVKVPRNSDSAGGLDLPVGEGADAPVDEVEIGAGEHAVAADVGDEQVATFVKFGYIPKA
jgi:hypothetical protein